MIYSAQSLVSSPGRTPIKYLSEEESIFEYGLDLLEETNIMVQNIAHERVEYSMMTGIPISESFDIIDFVGKIISWFVEMIKKLFGKFKSWILRIISSENYIAKNKERILGFTGSFEVDFERYIFTCTDPDVPKCGLSDHFGIEFDRLQSQLDGLNGIKTQQERLIIMRRIADDLRDATTEAYYGVARGSCLGLSYPIAQDNYAKELFNIFRNGGEHYVGKVNQIEVAQVYERFSKVKEMIRDVEKTKSEIVKSANKVKKQIKEINLKDVSKDYVPYDVSEEEAFDRIRQTKVNQIQKMCNIYTMAFSAKLEALKDSVSQDKRLLYEVITYLEVEG